MLFRSEEDELLLLDLVVTLSEDDDEERVVPVVPEGLVDSVLTEDPSALCVVVPSFRDDVV